MTSGYLAAASLNPAGLYLRAIHVLLYCELLDGMSCGTILPSAILTTRHKPDLSQKIRLFTVACLQTSEEAGFLDSMSRCCHNIVVWPR